MPLEIRELNIKAVVDTRTQSVLEKLAIEVADLGKMVAALRSAIEVRPNGDVTITANDLSMTASGRLAVRTATSLAVRADTGVTVDTLNTVINCSGNFQASAGKINLNGRNEASIISGTASIVLKGGGNVVISAGSTIDIKSSSMVNIKGSKVSTN